MAITQITTAEREAIRNKSAYSLPDNPAEQGYSAEDVKAALYGFITDATHSVITEINRIAGEAGDEITRIDGAAFYDIDVSDVNNTVTLTFKNKAGTTLKTKTIDMRVVTSRIVNAAVTNEKLASDSVSTAKIIDGNVTTDKLGAGAVTTAKIADGNVTTAKLSDSAVTTAKINNGAVTPEKLAAEAVETNNIDNGAVTTEKLYDAAVTADKLAVDSVTTPKLVDSAVSTAKINDAAVTEGKIANGAVTTDKLGANAVATNNINGGAVTHEKLASGVYSKILNAFVSVSYNSSTGVFTFTDNEGDTQTVDLPVESILAPTGSRYDNTTRKIILALRDGTEIQIPVTALVSELIEYIDGIHHSIFDLQEAPPLSSLSDAIILVTPTLAEIAALD